MLIRLICPFARYYRRKLLLAKWWHRLALVILICTVVLTFWLTFALKLGPDMESLKQSPPTVSPARSGTEHGPWERYATIANLPSLPKGYTAEVMLSGNGERLSFPPDTTREQMTRALCDHLKQGDEACWEVVEEDQVDPPPKIDEPALAKLKRRVIMRDFAIALVTSLAVSYLLQFFYRAVIFVALGGPQNREPVGNIP